jgi:hypothetical protein
MLLLRHWLLLVLPFPNAALPQWQQLSTALVVFTNAHLFLQGLVPGGFVLAFTDFICQVAIPIQAATKGS